MKLSDLSGMLKSTRAAIVSLTELGIRPSHSEAESRVLKRTNGIALVFLVTGCFESIACFSNDAIRAGLFNLVTIPYVLTVLLLMRAGWTMAARLTFMTVGVAGSYVLILILGPQTYIQGVLLVGSVVSLLMFTSKERTAMIYSQIITLTAFLILEFTDYAPILGIERISFSAQDLVRLRLFTVFSLWSSMAGSIYYLSRLHWRSQEQLVHAARMAALGEMASGMAHEVNNPLTLIVGHGEKLASLARAGQVPAAEALNIAERIVATALRIGTLVHGLHIFSSRVSENELLDRLPVYALVERALEFCRSRVQSKRIELRVADIPRDCYVLATESGVSQVLLNLIHNSLEAVELLDERWIEISVRDLGPKGVELVVTDSGTGIRPEVRKRMFEPFFSTKSVGKGNGLGLSVARGVLHHLHGELTYDASSPRTRFVARLASASH
jgi:signal transduction histidine kinase